MENIQDAQVEFHTTDKNAALPAHAGQTIKFVDGPTEPLVGVADEIGKLPSYDEPEADLKTFTHPTTADIRAAVETLKEVSVQPDTNGNFVQPVMVAYDAVKQMLDDADWKPENDIIVPLESVCACDTCVEEATEPTEEADSLNMAFAMIEELKERVNTLYARIDAHNVKASHKI